MRGASGSGRGEMKIVTQCIRLMVVGLAFVLLGSGCSGLGDSAARRGGAPLRVGVSPVYRPVVFREDDRIVGIEADFARRAGERLGRRVEFVEMLRHDLIPALEVGTIDVIMSGMSITPDRARRVLFTAFQARASVISAAPPARPSLPKNSRTPTPTRSTPWTKGFAASADTASTSSSTMRRASGASPWTPKKRA